MKFDDLIASIDALDAEQIDEVVDWQMTQSPAAKQEHSSGLAGRYRGYGIGLLPPSASILENPLQQMIDSIHGMLYALLPFPELLDVQLWLPGDSAAPAPHYLADRCAQCQRYMPVSNTPVDPEAPQRILFCDECAGMQHGS